MGVRQIRFCDISGTERDVKPHELQIDQMRIEIDLADPEYAKLLDMLRPYLDVGRVEASIPDSAALPSKQAPAGRPSSTALTREERQQLRAWAEGRGIDAPANNRFKRTVVEQWRRETGGGDPEHPVGDHLPGLD